MSISPRKSQYAAGYCSCSLVPKKRDAEKEEPEEQEIKTVEAEKELEITKRALNLDQARLQRLESLKMNHSRWSKKRSKVREWRGEGADERKAPPTFVLVVKFVRVNTIDAQYDENLQLEKWKTT